MKSNYDMFDGYAKMWNNFSFVQENAKNFLKYINEKIKLNQNLIIMDFGCGTGILGLSLINNVKKQYFQIQAKE